MFVTQHNFVHKYIRLLLQSMTENPASSLLPDVSAGVQLRPRPSQPPCARSQVPCCLRRRSRCKATRLWQSIQVPASGLAVVSPAGSPRKSWGPTWGLRGLGAVSPVPPAPLGFSDFHQGRICQAGHASCNWAASGSGPRLVSQQSQEPGFSQRRTCKGNYRLL